MPCRPYFEKKPDLKLKLPIVRLVLGKHTLSRLLVVRFVGFFYFLEGFDLQLVIPILYGI